MTTVLCLNGGSSSLKLALYALDGEREEARAEGAVERIGAADGTCRIGRAGETPSEIAGRFADLGAALDAAFDGLARLGEPRPDAVGHRLVHGGPEHTAPARIDAALLAALRRLTPFAPLHLPGELDLIEAVGRRFPDLPQVACFDTAFHHAMPAVAARLPLPRALTAGGLRRYGFHGLSYEYVVAHLGPAAAGRQVIAHLGNGASLAAVRDGRPVDTTMGLTPVGGLVMGTRTGDLDPGVLTYLLRTRGLDAAGLDHLVASASGLLGLSETTADMRELLRRRDTDVRAAEAVETFVYAVRKHLAAMAATLGGLDGLVFTGGIGESAATIRAEVCAGLGFLGLALDPARNAAHAERISADGAGCTVRVVRTNEDLMIARHTHALVERART